MVVDILVFNAHPDDEIHVAGTLSVLSDMGYKLGIIDLTNGEPTKNGSPELRLAESQAAAKVLGAEVRQTLDFQNRLLIMLLLANKRS